MRKIAGITLLLVSCAGPKIKDPDTKVCTVAGIIGAGLDCATTNTGKISSMDFYQMVDFLEPQKERPDPDHPGQKLPARAGAIIISDEDYTAKKEAFEQACVELKNRCTPQMKAAFTTPTANVDALLDRAKKKKGL